MRRLLAALRATLGTIRVGDLIPVGPKGFWVGRSGPGRSLRKAAMLFNQLGGATIVEIGTGLHGPRAGNSVLVWARRTAATRIVAVDINPKEIAAVRAGTARYPNVEAVVADGLEYLKGFPGAIDLLYPDFWVPGPDGALPGMGRADGYRDAYQAARNKLSPRALILIDDTDHVHPWKHTYVVPDARRDGYSVVYTGRQTLLRRTPERNG